MKEFKNTIQTFIEDHRERYSEILQNRLLDEIAFIRFSSERGIAVSGVVKGDPSKFLSMGWLESDEVPGAESHLFHPFRMYPLHVIVEACRLNITSSSSIDRDAFGEFLTKAKEFLPSIENIVKISKLANEATNLSIILEPIYWPIITSRTSWSGFIGFEDHKKLVDSYKETVFLFLSVA